MRSPDCDELLATFDVLMAFDSNWCISIYFCMKTDSQRGSAFEKWVRQCEWSCMRGLKGNYWREIHLAFYSVAKRRIDTSRKMYDTGLRWYFVEYVHRESANPRNWRMEWTGCRVILQGSAGLVRLCKKRPSKSSYEINSASSMPKTNDRA